MPAKRMHFDHHEFVLDLDPSWIRLEGNDPEQFQFESKPLHSTLTISVMMASIPPTKKQQAGEKLLEFRRKEEVAADPTRAVTFGDQWVKAKPDGEAVEVAYAGYDNRGSIFRFMGFVTTQKVVSFYCQTDSKDNEQTKGIFDETFRGFRFYVP
jgi:hypothetical protein